MLRGIPRLTSHPFSPQSCATAITHINRSCSVTSLGNGALSHRYSLLSLPRLFSTKSHFFTSSKPSNIGSGGSTSGNGPVPTIDIGAFLNGTEADKQRVAEALNRACEHIGFFSVVNHGVPKTVIDNCWSTTRGYFDRPSKEKHQIAMTEDYPYGYSGFAEENLSKGLGDQGSAPDLKECFCIGPYNPKSGIAAPIYPKQPLVTQQHWHAYYQAMEQLSATLLRIFARALKLNENWFEDKIDHHRCALRFLNYPEQTKPPLPNQIRAGAHTDYGSLTILLQDNVGGLQVQTRSGVWQDVISPANSFVINLGDLMARWTNDKWVSTLHRVVNPRDQIIGKQRRQSIAFFHNINHDHLVETIPTCLDAKGQSKYQPITAWDHLMEKHLASVGQGKHAKS